MRVKLVLAAAAAALLASPATAALFTDNFESGLAQWQARTGFAFEGQIVTDPLNAANKVLSFTQLNSGGSILSAGQFSGSGGPYVLKFDYLGLNPNGSGTANDFGGFAGVGIASGDPCNCWLAGTQASYVGSFGPVTHLLDDGQWRTYSITFDPASQGALNPLFRLMLEDYSGSGGVPGDAYFDNISLSQIPEPSTYALLLGGLAVLAMLRRRA
jgi:hypothetical protein